MASHHSVWKCWHTGCHKVHLGQRTSCIASNLLYFLLVEKLKKTSDSSEEEEAKSFLQQPYKHKLCCLRPELIEGFIAWVTCKSLACLWWILRIEYIMVHSLGRAIFQHPNNITLVNLYGYMNTVCTKVQFCRNVFFFFWEECELKVVRYS